MTLPVMPTTHTWVQLGPGFSKAGRNALFVGDDADVWAWDEETDQPITDLLDASGSPVTSVPVQDGWVGSGNPPGIGVPVGVRLLSFSIGRSGKRMATVPVQTFLDAASALAPTDTQVATLLGNPTSDTRAAADARYATTADLTSGTTRLPYIPTATINLPNPAYIAHRGGAGIAPEETIDAYRVSVATGADGIEMDLQPLADGGLGLLHDSTVDRTTDGTGNASTFTTPAFLSLNAASKFPWNGRVVPPAMLPQVLGEFGRSTTLWVEPKSPSDGTRLLDALDAGHYQATVIVCSSTLSVCQAAKARGYATLIEFFSNPTTTQLSDAVAAGVDFLGCDGTSTGLTDAQITTLVATGIPVMAWTVNRRTETPRLLSLGVKVFLTDQPVYLKQTTAMRTIDSWRQGVPGHGLNVNATSPDSSKVSISGGALTLSQQAPLTATPGEVCPLANAAGTYTIDVDLGFGTLPASGGSVIVLFGMPTDKNCSLATTVSWPDGYMLLLRATGGMSLYRLADGSNVGTQLGTTVTTAALTAGGLAHLKVTVTPTQITASRTDSAGTIGPVSDATFRGAYIALGKKDVVDGTVTMKNLAIT